MNFIYETLIVIAIALVEIGFASFICFRGRDEHYFIKTTEIMNDHYVLKNTRFLFLFAYGLTWNWKTGIIRKWILWVTVGFYSYFMCFYIADLTYYLVTHSYMILVEPIYFIVFAAIIPIVASIIISVATLNKRAMSNISNAEVFSSKTRDSILNSADNDDGSGEIK